MPSAASSLSCEAIMRVRNCESAISSPDPLCHDGGFCLAFNLDRQIPGDLDSSFELLDGIQRTVQPNSGTDGNGGGESNSVESIVDASCHITVDLNGITVQMAQHRKGEESVSDCRPVWRFPFCSFGISVNPLGIERQIRKLVDHRLGDGEPIAHPDFLPLKALELNQTVNDRWGHVKVSSVAER